MLGVVFGSFFLECQTQETPPPIPFKRLFKTFQIITRDIVRISLHEDERPLFKSPLSAARRLATLGFAQSTPKTKFLVECNPSERKALGIELLRLRANFTKGMMTLFLTGELRIPPTTFNFKRKLAPIIPLSTLPAEPWVPCAPGPTPNLLPTGANFQRAKYFCDNFTITCHVCLNVGL